MDTQYKIRQMAKGILLNISYEVLHTKVGIVLP